MIKINKPDKCCGCSACVQKCPQNCIDFKLDNEGFYYPQVKMELCIDCGLCESVCPFNVEISTSKQKPLESFACYAKDRSIHRNSSSGGIFSLLAELILEEGGIVYGTALSDDCRSARVISVRDVSELYRLRGSKYLQSLTKDVFMEIQNYLCRGKLILFSGTPCQVSALKRYLGKEYENLFCTDIICHGTPSPQLWRCYVEYKENKYHSKIVNVNFRYKNDSWKYSESKERRRSRQVYINRRHDTYMQMFSHNYCLRPSCYNCKAKFYSMADVTLGDFWGIERVAPEFDNGLGTSIVLLRTSQGRNLFYKISEILVKKKVDYSDAVVDNKAEYLSVQRPVERDSFFKDMNCMDYESLFRKYLYPTPKLRLKKFLIDLGVWDILEKVRGRSIHDLQYGMLLQMEKECRK